MTRADEAQPITADKSHDLFSAEPVKEDPIKAAEAKLASLLSQPDADDFDWNKDASTVLEEQPATAVYLNNREHVVIRQRALPYGDENSFVHIAPQKKMTPIDALYDLAGVASGGKKRR